MAVLCTTAVANFINDYNAFIQGGPTANVTLSDGFVMPSYQKYMLSQIVSNAATWTAATTYIIDDMISWNGALYVSLTNNVGKQPDVSTIDWKLISFTGTKSGRGIIGFVSFQLKSGNIITSKNVLAVNVLNSNEFSVVVNDSIRAGAGKKLVYAISYDSVEISSWSRIAGASIYTDLHYDYFISGRTELNLDNTIQILINGAYVNWNSRIDIIFAA
jgi:hypothetical protein